MTRCADEYAPKRGFEYDATGQVRPVDLTCPGCDYDISSHCQCDPSETLSEALVRVRLIATRRASALSDVSVLPQLWREELKAATRTIDGFLNEFETDVTTAMGNDD